MSARAIGSGTVSFGLVSIPVKVYSSQETGSHIHFNMLHGACGSRLKQQYYCPTDQEIVKREDMARGYEFAKGRYVTLSDEEYKALLEESMGAIELTEFVPAAKVDPVFYEKTYYLGTDKGGERAYRLLGEAMIETGLVGLAKYSARGRQYLVLVRPNGDRGLIMHQLRYADEVKPFSEVPIKDAPEPKKPELDLAIQIIEQIANKDFQPQGYTDEVKARIQDKLERKVEGEEITAAPEAPAEGQIIDLMQALKASLGQPDAAAGEDAPAEQAPSEPKPAKAARRSSTRAAKSSKAASKGPAKSSAKTAAKSSAAKTGRKPPRQAPTSRSRKRDQSTGS